MLLCNEWYALMSLLSLYKNNTLVLTANVKRKKKQLRYPHLLKHISDRL